MTPQLKISLLVLIGLFFAFLCGLTAMLAGFGSRWGWWYFRTGFTILRWSAYGGLCAAVVCGIGLIGSFYIKIYDGFVLAMLGMLIGLITAGNTWSWKQSINNHPPIHDITTDTENPPRFAAILPLRKDATNSAEYGGLDIATQQLKAYPDVKPLITNLPVDAAFDKALAIARGMRWEIVDANKNEGRIEAVDTTFWFGFKDDIIIRITRDGTRSRIDLRSVSRVGRTDVGTNAKRIRAFLKQMQG